jgi:hypothetical protein
MKAIRTTGVWLSAGLLLALLACGPGEPERPPVPPQPPQPQSVR